MGCALDDGYVHGLWLLVVFVVWYEMLDDWIGGGGGGGDGSRHAISRKELGMRTRLDETHSRNRTGRGREREKWKLWGC